MTGHDGSSTRMGYFIEYDWRKETSQEKVDTLRKIGPVHKMETPRVRSPVV